MVLDPLVRFPTTRRAVAKQQTRRRLIAAAKQLAGERGYDAATLRDVAALASLSTGAVFANFSDKADLFAAAIIEDDEALAALMKRAAEGANSPRQALLNMLMAVQAAQQDELAWVKVKMSLLWSCDGAGRPGRAARTRPIEAALAEVVQGGVSSGALAATIDAALIAEMAWDAYLAGCRRAIFDGWTPERLRARLVACVGALLDGYEIRGLAGRESSGRAPVAMLPRALRG